MMAKFYRGKFMIKVINAVLLSVSSSVGVAAVSIPETLRPPLGHHQTLMAHAKGDQIYLCNTVNKAYHWTIQAPDALLLNERGERIGKHYQGLFGNIMKVVRCKVRFCSVKQSLQMI